MRKKIVKPKAKPQPNSLQFKVGLSTAAKLAKKYPHLTHEGAIEQLLRDAEPKMEAMCSRPTPPVRVQILEKGADLTCGDRNKAYGDAVTNMQHMAGMLTAYFRNLIIARGPAIVVGYDYKDKPYEFTGEDAAQIMVIAKQSRTANRGVKYHEDNYIDAAVYSAMAGECADKERSIV